MKVNNKVAAIIVIATIVVLAFLIIFVTKLVTSAKPKQQEINKNIERELDDIIGENTENSNMQINIQTNDVINSIENQNIIFYSVIKIK